MEGVVVMFSKTKTDLDPGILLDLQILLSGELCFFFHFKNNLHKENLNQVRGQGHQVRPLCSFITCLKTAHFCSLSTRITREEAAIWSFIRVLF